jgi:hypothetical protein
MSNPGTLNKKGNTMKLPLSGGCLCGAVRYEILAEPAKAVNCHCRTCQKAMGAAYSAFFLVPAEALKISGECTEYATTAGSGNTIYRAFCPICGTTLFGRHDAPGGLRPVAAATLDDPGVFKPEMDIWVADAQPWDIMHPDLPKFAGNPVRS